MDPKKKVQKSENIYTCDICDFECSKKSKYDRHLNTRKHKILTNPNSLPKNPNLILTQKRSNAYKCDCGKTYKHKSSLSYHKNKCNFISKNDYNSQYTQDNKKIDTIYSEILKDNQELRNILIQQQEHMKEQQHQIAEQQKQMAEIIPRIGNTTHNNHRFNLQVFLNTECKEAVNWQEFINSLAINVSETDKSFLKEDLTQDITKAICSSIKDLGIYKRPIHCIDVKRKKLCIKDNHIWSDNIEIVNSTLDKTTNYIQAKYHSIIADWLKNHPKWQDNEEDSKTYMSLLSKATGTIDTKKCTSELIKNTLIPKDS